MLKTKVTYLLITVFIIPLIFLMACSITRQIPVEETSSDVSITQPAPPDKKAISAKMMNLQIPFIENQGQLADEIK